MRTNFNPCPECEPLSSVEVGRRAALCHLAEDGALRARLADLGFVPGTVIEVVRRAPLGDPLELRVRGTHLCLRTGEACGVFVHPLPGPP